MLAALGGLVLTASIGCAHSSPGATSRSVQADSTELPILPAPQTQDEARRALELAFAAAGVGDDELAAAQFRAVLASDYLTDMGRMNVYWHCAAAHHRMGDKAGERDALEGFLLSAQLVDLTEDDAARAELAHDQLVKLSARSGPLARARSH